MRAREWKGVSENRSFDFTDSKPRHPVTVSVPQFGTSGDEPPGAFGC
jgi:hypothetical protein